MVAGNSQTSTDNIAQRGVNAVETIFLEMRWLFRRQLESDFGIDAQVEVVEDGRPTGQLVAVQIKSGASFFRVRGSGYVFRGERRHLNYWEGHCLPVIVVIHNPVDGTTLWQRVERHLVRDGADGAWSIAIPKQQALEAGSAAAISESLSRSDPQSTRRNQMILDADLIRRVGREARAYVTVVEWVNKGLNFRSASLSFGEHDAPPDHALAFHMRADNPSRVFDWIFPWLDFAYLDRPQDDGGEVMAHAFEVRLNAVGQAFLTMERYYSAGAEPSPDVDVAEPTGEVWGEEELASYAFERAQREDWEAEAREGLA